MKRARSKELILAAVMFGCLAGSSTLKAQSEDVAVVVNKQNPVNGVSSTELQRMFMGEMKFWSKSNNAVTVIMRAPGAPERDMALKVVFRMSEAEYKKYWIGRVNSGEASSAPAEVFASGALQGLVREIPGAIGLVKTSEVRSPLKVLKVDGRLPGDPGYNLRENGSPNKNVTISDAGAK
jgi:ABC-type phosphate transport system substrate-binding protein